ncbi:hypothetical protein Tco_1289641 [Tanacetum coccineum]
MTILGLLYVIKETSVQVNAASTKVSIVIPTTVATTITAVSLRPRAKGIVFHEQEQEQEQAPTLIVSSQQPTQVKDKANVKADYQLAQRLQAQEQEVLSDAEKATLFVQLLEKRRKHFAAKRVEEKRNRPPTKAHQRRKLKQRYHKKAAKREQEKLWHKKALRSKRWMMIKKLKSLSNMYLTFGKMLKKFDKEDLEVLWSIVKARFKKTEPVNYMDIFLHLNLKTMFEHHLEDSVWKNQQGLVKVLTWKLYDSSGVHYVTMHNILYYLLVEKMYPLTKHTLYQVFNKVKLQVDYECEMAFELLRLVKK